MHKISTIQSLFVFFTIVVFFISSCNSNNSPNDALTKKEQLGRYLFFDTRLSLNGTKSCASCHSNKMYFSDGYRKSITSLGENVPHNAPILINSKFLHYYDWANPAANSFAIQIKRPLYGNHPIELGLDKSKIGLQRVFSSDSIYSTLFKAVYGIKDSLFTLSQIEEAIVAYENRLISFSAPFDNGKMDEDAQKGFTLFKGAKLNCAKCHPPPYFTLASTSINIDSVYSNTGLYNLDNKNQYPSDDIGLMTYSKRVTDNGKFKIPTLRNVMQTAPYMHDGSVNTIEEVIDIYARGGREINYGKYKGDGKNNQLKNKLITGFDLTQQERKELLSFLNSLTDTSILTNKIFQNPFSNQ